MAGVTSGMAQTFKAEILQGGHCFNGTVTTVCTTINNSTAITAIISGSGISVGMGISGTGIPTNAVVAAIVSASAVTSSLQSTASGSPTLTFTGDLYKMALFSAAPNGTYTGGEVGSQNYVGMGSDEVPTGTGYTAAGNLLVNVTPSVNSTQGITTFSVNPSWTTATFSTSGCMIYNTSTRVIGNTSTGSTTETSGRAAAVYYFGTQTVSSGTFTVVMPTAAANTSILQIR